MIIWLALDYRFSWSLHTTQVPMQDMIYSNTRRGKIDSANGLLMTTAIFTKQIYFVIFHNGLAKDITIHTFIMRPFSLNILTWLHTKCLWRWEPDHRSNFYSPPSYLCAVTYVSDCDVKQQIHLDSPYLTISSFSPNGKGRTLSCFGNSIDRAPVRTPGV